MVNAPDNNEISMMKSGANIVSFVAPAQNEDFLKTMAAAKIIGLNADPACLFAYTARLNSLLLKSYPPTIARI